VNHTTRAPRVRARASALLAAALLAGTCTVGTSFAAATGRRAAVPLTPAQARITFEERLGQHAFLIAALMRAEVRDEPDFAEAANAAVVRNSRDLGNLVARVHGADAGKAFETLWVKHVNLLDDFASAVGDGDTAARDKAAAALDAYRSAYGAFVASATGGAITAADAAENLEMHLDQLMAHATAFAQKHYAAAEQLERQAYAHMFPTGKAIAGGLVGTPSGELPLVPDAALQLQSSLGLLLGEHFQLAVEAMRAGLRDAPEFDAAKDALDANARDLTDAFDGIFGAAAAQKFNRAWADHIDTLYEYTAAVADDDDTQRATVVAEMKRHEGVLASEFASLTGNRLPVAAARDALSMHDRDLREQIEQYAANDYTAAHRISYAGYQHMFDVAAELTTPIEQTVAAAAPVGGVQTGGGGMAAEIAAGT
jgi:hypothetical protein